MGESKNRPLRLEFHGEKVRSDARYVVFQMAEVAIPKRVFDAILQRICLLVTLILAPT